MKFTSSIEEQILKQINFYRAALLDSLELSANPESWPRVRKIVLRALGESGLQGSIQNILGKSDNGGWDSENTTF
jgi:hypothetical protein